jgi:hypothetical protein
MKDTDKEFKSFMKTRITNSISRFILLGLTMPLLLAVGCTTHRPDPLAGWATDLAHQPSPVIVEDYQAYIGKLPPREKHLVDKYSIWFYRNDAGEHAVRIEIPLNGIWWEHVLYYSKENQRIKTVKYSTGGYRS